MRSEGRPKGARKGGGNEYDTVFDHSQLWCRLIALYPTRNRSSGDIKRAVGEIPCLHSIPRLWGPFSSLARAGSDEPSPLQRRSPGALPASHYNRDFPLFHAHALKLIESMLWHLISLFIGSLLYKVLLTYFIIAILWHWEWEIIEIWDKRCWDSSAPITWIRIQGLLTRKFARKMYNEPIKEAPLYDRFWVAAMKTQIHDRGLEKLGLCSTLQSNEANRNITLSIISH